MWQSIIQARLRARSDKPRVGWNPESRGRRIVAAPRSTTLGSARRVDYPFAFNRMKNQIFEGLRGYVGAGVLLAGLLMSSRASADEPATANVVQIGVGFRYGIDLKGSDFNPWGPGIGVNAGYTLSNAVYLGGNFDYFFGSKKTIADVDFTGNIWQLMAEGGYDVGLGSKIVIRPKVGVGFAALDSKACPPQGDCLESSAKPFALAPGATFLLLTSHFMLTLDARYDIVFADEKATALLFSVGIGF